MIPTITLPTLTIRQPWATALVDQRFPKTIETRPARIPAKYLGVDVAIIAGAWKPAAAEPLEIDEWMVAWRVAHPTEMHRLPNPNWPLLIRQSTGEHLEFPLGRIIGVVRFVECLPILWVDDANANDFLTEAVWVEHANDMPTDLAIGCGSRFSDYRDATPNLPWGDYSHGRWAWIADPAHSRLLDRPIPARGAQHWQMVEVSA